MRYMALACDYDGTLARHGQVDEPTIAALKKLRASGRKVVLASGREMRDLHQVFPDLEMFELIVAENGGVLYVPATRQERMLAEGPPEPFVQRLRELRVEPLSVGKVVVATWEPYETTVLQAIHDLGLELQVIFNKGAVMVLPAGVNKGSGLKAALTQLQLSPHNVVGIGDAENDHSFLKSCEFSVAVANALPTLKDQVDVVTEGDHGAGVIEIIEQLVADDLADLDARITRHDLVLGKKDDGTEVCMNPGHASVLVAGPSGSGKSTIVLSILEQLTKHGYQFCLFDPEGDYETMEGAVALGNSDRVPTPEEIMQLLVKPEGNVVVNLLGLPLADRPSFFTRLLPRLEDLHVRTARPHWLVVDEAHHLLSRDWNPAGIALPGQWGNILLVTVHPDHVANAALQAISLVIAVGDSPQKTCEEFCAPLGIDPPRLDHLQPEKGEAVAWRRDVSVKPFLFRAALAHIDRQRHRRKYSEGELGADKSFYFRGPDGKLNLRAQNLMIFTQIADGVDDATWLHHLRQGDYSRWFRESIKDEDLAAEASGIEQEANVSAAESREAIKSAIEQRYTSAA
jgi:HAD superfamily hydrolase (TIGR01484 family)